MTPDTSKPTREEFSTPLAQLRLLDLDVYFRVVGAEYQETDTICQPPQLECHFPVSAPLVGLFHLHAASPCSAT